MPIAIYGIKNCDTMKKARAWLDQRSVAYAFHDYKTAGIERERLERWSNKVCCETLIRRAGTTFKNLPDKVKARLTEKRALALMLKQPSMIELPVRNVGVMGDGRTYDFVVGLRAVTSTDGMTADFYPFDMGFIGRVATRIINEVKGVNRVVYDVTSKPPGTIEWE